jgi:tRNA threonylcarbamoyl adenosine modification protein YeaZ
VTDRDGWLLAIDTATSRVVVAAGLRDGTLIAARTFPAEHRHGERLLATIEALVHETGLRLGDLAGIVVGIGPGAFTGLRVGLATAKTLAHELGAPIVGLSTGEALLDAAGLGLASDGAALLLPAGPHDRVAVRVGQRPRLLARGAEPDRAPGAALVAVDLDGRAPAAALGLGRRALDGLAVALLRRGAARLGAASDDPARLVPEYVTLPRGVPEGLDMEGGVSWAREPR